MYDQIYIILGTKYYSYNGRFEDLEQAIIKTFTRFLGNKIFKDSLLKIRNNYFYVIDIINDSSLVVLDMKTLNRITLKIDKYDFIESFDDDVNCLA